MGKGSRPSLLVPVKKAHAWANHRAGWLFLAGLAVVGLNQWRLWRQDQARFRRRPPPAAPPPLEAWPRLPRLTALVAGWNEAEHIQAHIQSFLRLRYPHKELVLVLGGEDGTFELAQPYAGDSVRLLRQLPGEGKQRALRRGLDLALGEIIYLTDADCHFDDQSFERLLWPLAVQGAAAVTGASRPFPQDLCNPFVVSQAAAQIYAAYHAPGDASGLLGRNCAVERGLLEKSGGLDLPAPTGTDYVLAKALLRSGASIRHIPESQVASEYPRAARPYLRQQRRWLFNVYRHGARFGAWGERRNVIRTALLGLAMLAAPLAIPFAGPWLAVVWTLLALHACLSRLRYLVFAGRILTFTPTWRHYLAMPIYFLLDLFAWASALPHLLCPRRPETW